MLTRARFHPLLWQTEGLPCAGHKSSKKTSLNPLNHLQPIFRKPHRAAFYSLFVKAVLQKRTFPPLKGEI